MKVEDLQKIVNKAVREQDEHNPSYTDDNYLFNGYTLEEYLYNYKNDEYSFKETDSFGGEGMGDEIWRVFEVTNLKTEEKIHFRVSGWYDSWNDTEWNEGLELVEPYEVTVIKWKNIKD